MEENISSVDSKMEKLNAAFFKCHMAKIMNLYKHVPDVGDIWATKQNFQVSLFQGREKKKIDTVKLFLGMLNLSVKGILEL